MNDLRVLFVGDVFGSPGMRVMEHDLRGLIDRTRADLVVANGENAAGGYGITPGQARRLHGAGVDVITTGNHVWAKRALRPALPELPRLLRPANTPPGTPGRGWCVVSRGGVEVGVVNLLGRVFMAPADCPFRAMDRVLDEMVPRPPVVVVDFHAEATSEKRAMGWYLDGRVSAVVGTHTHVATADAQVLPCGTGYLTDAGMTGVTRSVIGLPTEKAVRRFVTGVPSGGGAAEGPAEIQGAVVVVDLDSGRCVGVEPVCFSEGAMAHDGLRENRPAP